MATSKKTALILKFNELSIEFGKTIETVEALRGLVSKYNSAVTEGMDGAKLDSLLGLLKLRTIDVNDQRVDAEIRAIIAKAKDGDYTPVWKELLSRSALKADGYTLKHDALTKEQKDNGVHAKLNVIDAKVGFRFKTFMETFEEVTETSLWKGEEMTFTEAIKGFCNNSALTVYNAVAIGTTDDGVLKQLESSDFELEGSQYTRGTMTACRELGKYIMKNLLPENFKASDETGMCFKKSHIQILGLSVLRPCKEGVRVIVDEETFFGILRDRYQCKDTYELVLAK